MFGSWIFTFSGFSILSTIISAWGFFTLFLSRGFLPLDAGFPFSGSIFETVRHVSFFCEDPFRATLRNQFQTFWMACLVDTVRNHRLLLFHHLLALLPKTLGRQSLPEGFPFWNTAPFSLKNAASLYCCYRRWSYLQKIVDCFQLLTVFSKKPILDVSLGSEYISGDCNLMKNLKQ